MIYAQYRLGQELIGFMPPDMRRTVGRFRQLYDMGLHGPELFLNQGRKYQQLSGEAFFQRACRLVRMEHSEAALAYLYGLVAHYALASRVNPLIHIQSRGLSLSEEYIGTEFDRFLLEQDGKVPPHRYDRSLHIRLTPGERETVALFYPGLRPETVGLYVKEQAFVLRQSAKTEGTRRDLTQKMLRITGADHRMMGLHPDRRLASTNRELLALYQQAKDSYPRLLAQIQVRLRSKVHLGPDFSATFA